MSYELAIIERLKELGGTVEPCGSRVTCVPAPQDTDHDFLVELPKDDHGTVSSVVNEIAAAGYAWEGNEHYQDMARNDFMSWRKGDINLIVTANPDFAMRHRSATHVCRRLNLQRKPDRIALFQAVLYGNQWTEEAPT